MSSTPLLVNIIGPIKMYSIIYYHDIRDHQKCVIHSNVQIIQIEEKVYLSQVRDKSQMI